MRSASRGTTDRHGSCTTTITTTTSAARGIETNVQLGLASSNCVLVSIPDLELARHHRGEGRGRVRLIREGERELLPARAPGAEQRPGLDVARATLDLPLFHCNAVGRTLASLVYTHE